MPRASQGMGDWHEVHTGAWTADGRGQWSIRGCYIATWFRTESASHLQERKWLSAPHPLRADGGVTVGEWCPVLLTAKPHPQRLEERNECTTGLVSKENCSRMQMFTPWRAWKTLDPQKKAACSHTTSSHPAQGADVGNMNTHGILQANH